MAAKTMSNQWNPPKGGYTKNFINKDRSAWKIPSAPPVPVIIIIKRILMEYQEGVEIHTRSLYKKCKKVNANITPKMFHFQILKLCQAGELLWIRKMRVMIP